jgi:hypothetical protein
MRFEDMSQDMVQSQDLEYTALDLWVPQKQAIT